jgi:MFS family permease
MYKFINQYRGLNREIYILFLGRVIGALGTFIWPLLTLILTVKLGYKPSQVAAIMVVGFACNLPAGLIGGKLTDHYGRKKIIILSNVLMVSCFYINAFIPISSMTVILFFISSFFGTIQGPAYDALLADKSTSDQRAKAYSLSYMGFNLGFILGPAIGGFLFQDYLWLAFLIDGTTSLLGTLMILFFVKETKMSDIKHTLNAYEQIQEGESTWSILLRSKTLWIYLACSSLVGLMYTQTNFLLPIQLEATIPDYSQVYGFMYSLNGLVVILATPVLTFYLKKINEVNKFGIAIFFFMSSFLIYAFLGNFVLLLFLGMIVFTFGEVINTIANAAYFSRRVPASHRGRISSMIGLIAAIVGALAQITFGFLVDFLDYRLCWLIIISLGVLALTLIPLFRRSDRRDYNLLYEGTL